MSTRLARLMGEISSLLNDLPDVFSTPQWGGRAYKLPGPNGSLKKPKLLAFVVMTRDQDAVSVVFKLPKSLSDETPQRFGWIEPFNFGNWKNAGWINARITDGRQLRTLKRLLKECRALFPDQIPQPETASGAASHMTSDSVASRIDRVVTKAIAEGWSPPDEMDGESFG